MNDSDFRILVIADIHHQPGATAAPADNPQRRVDLALELLRRALDDARNRGGFDAIALMGDLLDDGTAAGAKQALEQMRDLIRIAAPKTPLLLVPGNHDGPPQQLAQVFCAQPGVHELGQYNFAVFADKYAAGDLATRSDRDRQTLAALAAKGDKPIIALQHNPMDPAIDEPLYPYMLANRDEVLADYSCANVLLSISGHYHSGQEHHQAGGVGYFTCPALCEWPYRYAMIELTGRQAKVNLRQLAAAGDVPIVDSHVHTQFAYCGKNIHAQGMISRAAEFGLAGLCLVEHAPQLYCRADDFWNGRHVRQPGLWRNQEHWRIDEFRDAMEPLRSPGVRLGLEVELDAAGELALRDEERHWADLLVGAVHFLPSESASLSDAQMADEFMRTTEGLLQAGVQILAHPLRVFRWAQRQAPSSLHRPLAQMLAQSNTAAEINFHGNQPEDDFFTCCLEQGVKIAFGSDAHEFHEVGNLGANLAMLRRLAGTQDVAHLLYYQ